MLTGSILMDFFKTIKDPRLKRKQEHQLVDILVITFCAVFSRCESWYEIQEFAEDREEFFRTFLELPGGIPSHDTFNRVFQLLNFDHISTLLMQWLEQFRQTSGREIIHIDGKFLNGSNKEAQNSRSSLGLISAYASETGICLLSVMTRLEKGEGEKKSIESLVDALVLRKSIVTIDAAGATPAIVSKIVKQGGDYLIALKNNQKSFFNFANECFKQDSKQIESFTTEQKSHGRSEKRIYEQLLLEHEKSSGFEQCLEKQKDKFPHLSSLVKVTSIRAIGGQKPREQVRYYFTSLKTDVHETAAAIRSHWSIENNLHWVLDVHFREDHCRTRSGYADANLALLRRLVISIVKRIKPEKKSIKSVLLRCSWNNDNLIKMLKLSAL